MSPPPSSLSISLWCAAPVRGSSSSRPPHHVAATLSPSPASAVFGRSGLTQIERNVVLLTTDFENNCGYCMAADSTIALNTGLDREIVVAIREGRVIQSDARLEALHQFTRAMVRERGLVERHDIDAFLRAGFTKANVLDVVTGVTLKTMSNYTNHIAETELDDSFAPMAWSKPLLQHAD